MGNTNSNLPEPPGGRIFYNVGLRNFTIVNSVILILFALIYTLVYFLHTTKDWVDAKNCVSPIGEFTVEPGISVTTPLEACPDATYNNTDQCIYVNVVSLLQATRICNQKADICNRFVYNTQSRKMSIVSLQSPSSEGDQNDNVYTRQNNITFRTAGLDPTEAPVPVASPSVAITENNVSDITTSIVEILGLPTLVTNGI